MKVNKLLPRIAIPFKFAVRHTVSLALMGAIAAILGAATAQAQNTQVTIEGTITSVGSQPGITVGDKYSMVVYYNPTQAPSSTGDSGAFYTGYTLNAVIDDTHGNQSFSAAPGEQLFVEAQPGETQFVSSPCCGSDATGAGFVLQGTQTVSPFKSDALPTALTLADFTDNFVAFGIHGATGNITSLRVDDTGGIVAAFMTAGPIDPAGKVPTLNGVPGSGVLNADIALPLTLLAHGTSYEYTIAFEDVNFTGTCVVSFTLTQIQFNKTVTLDSGKNTSFTCDPGTQWLFAFTGKPIPNFPGPAILTGTVTYGTTKANIASIVVFD
jgi:hypothetical protein